MKKRRSKFGQFLLDKLKEITDEEREILEGKKPSTNIVYKHKILDDGKLIKIWPHTRFIHFPAHSHNYIEIVYMCQGCTHHIINNNEIILNKGELLFL